MKRHAYAFPAVLGMFAFLPLASAADLLTTSGTLTAGDPTESGRLNRPTGGVQSDWSASKTFPGTLNTGTFYHYRTYTINPGLAQYIQVEIDDPSGAFFVSAYLDSYNAASEGTNYLGDEATSGDNFGVNRRSFQVVVPAGHNVVILVNEVVVGGGLGPAFGLQVEGFTDVQFTNPGVSITNVTSSVGNGTYGAAASIPIQVTFGAIVNVTGTPQLALNSGGTASYGSGTGTATLTFNYAVAAGQNSAKLDYTSTSALTLNGGTIKDAGSNNANLTLPAPGATGSLGANKNIVIDTTAPTVTNVTSTTVNGTYGTGTLIPIQVTFSKTVNVTGTPQLALNSGGTASYTSGSGASTLTFNYTVAAGQNSAKLDYTSTSALTLNGGTIKDAANNNANLTLAAPGAAGSLGANKNIVINTTSGGGTPGVVSLSPVNGSGNNTFTMTVSDTAGNADIGLAYLLFNTFLTPHYACLVLYDATNNFLLLYNDAGTALVPGTITPGTAGTLANTRCQISGTGASVVRAGNNLSVAVPITFLGAFVGTNTQYVYVVTKENVTAGYAAEGTWTGSADGTPTISPSQFTSSGNPQTFNITYSDSTSGENIALAYAFFGENLVLNNTCVIAYSAGINLIYLLNDAGTGLAGSITPGAVGTAANSQCTIASGGATSVAGANLTVPVNITASAPFGGLKNAWGYALNSVGANSGFVQIGTWLATPNVTPGTITMPAPSGTGNGPYTLQVTYSDANGYLDLEDTTLLVTGNGSAANACDVVYAPAYNAAFLLDDTGTGYVAGFVTPGVVGAPIANTHCSLQSAGAPTNNGSTTLTLPLQLTFTSFTGAKTIYGQAFDASGAISTFQMVGTVTLP